MISAATRAVYPHQGPGLVITGDHVRTLPHTDAFMRGDRWGTVEKVGRKWVHVRMDRSARLLRFRIDNGSVPGLGV